MAGMSFIPKDRFLRLKGSFEGVDWEVSVHNYADNAMLFFFETRAGLQVVRAGPYEFTDVALHAGCWQLDKMLPDLEINMNEVEYGA